MREEEDTSSKQLDSNMETLSPEDPKDPTTGAGQELATVLDARRRIAEGGGLVPEARRISEVLGRPQGYSSPPSSAATSLYSDALQQRQHGLSELASGAGRPDHGDGTRIEQTVQCLCDRASAFSHSIRV